MPRPFSTICVKSAAVILRWSTIHSTVSALTYVTDKRLVRGLDYYTRTTFEIQTGALGAQSAVAGGGRYDGLVKVLGGPDMPATGFAIGLDRLAEIVGQKERSQPKSPELYVAALGAEGQQLAFLWINRWCELGLWIEMDFGDRSLKSQMKRADKLDAKYVMIIGDNEIKQSAAVLRNMKTKKQEPIPFDKILQKVQQKRLKSTDIYPI